MLPAIYAVAQTGFAAAASSGVAAVGDAIARRFGSGKEDQARRAEVQALYARALNGDGVAFRQLEFTAFEKRTGQPGDLRPVPPDRSASPPASRAAAKAALTDLLSKGRQLSKQEYYAALGVPVPQNFVQRITAAAAGQVADAARPVVQSEVSDAVRKALPYVVALLLALGAGAFLLGRSARA